MARASEVLFPRSVDMKERKGWDSHVAQAGHGSQHLDPDGSRHLEEAVGGEAAGSVRSLFFSHGFFSGH